MEDKNKETISLGGNIELNGFQKIDVPRLIVLKKIVGNCAKQISEKTKNYEKLTVNLQGDDSNSEIRAELKAGGSSKFGEAKDNNLFVAVDAALKKIIEQI